MPYVRHRTDTPIERLQEVIDQLLERPEEPFTWTAAVGQHDAVILGTHDNPTDARAACQPGEKVTYVMSEQDRRNWIRRETDRFATDQYVKVPWHLYEPVDAHRFPHMSLDKPGLIAFTQSPEHGFLDRQTRVRPGKYLIEYFPDWSKETIDRYVAACQAMNLELKIARSPEEIKRVYIGGPSSCMAKPADAFGSNPIHPVEVYGDSDLAVAYYGPIERVSGRAIVWPAKKRYGRIYGGERVMTQILEANGYQKGSMSGARVRALRANCNCCWIMPYVDGIYYGETVRENDKVWIRLGSGEISCQQTEGLSNGSEDENEPEPEPDWICDHCSAGYLDDEQQYTSFYRNRYNGTVRECTICCSCSDAFYRACDDCGNNWYREHLTDVGGDYLCQSCANDRPQIEDDEEEQTDLPPEPQADPSPVDRRFVHPAGFSGGIQFALVHPDFRATAVYADGSIDRNHWENITDVRDWIDRGLWIPAPDPTQSEAA